METKHSSKRVGKRVKQTRVVGKVRKSNYDLQFQFERYATAKRSEGRAESTIETNRYAFNTFIQYLEVNDIEKDLRNIDVSLCRDYVLWLMEEYIRFDGHKYKPDYEKTPGVSITTTNNYIKRLRSFFNFLVYDDVIEVNPFNKVNTVKEENEQIEVLTADELKQLLNAPNRRNYSDFRDYVLMTCLIDGLFRISEAVNLKVRDVDFTAHCVTVRASIAKNRKSRIVPLQRRTINLLKELMTEVEEFDSEYIFLANYGEPLTTNHFRKQLKKVYLPRTTINKRIYPHLFRHTGATMFLEAGGDIRHLQMLLGHSDLRMTMRYTHLSNKSLSEQHSKYSPLNNVVDKLNKQRKIKR